MPDIGPIPVVAAIIWREGRFLSAQRPEGKDYAGWWEFPGGKVETGETLSQALVRELHEELGILAVDYTFWLEKVVEYPEYTVKLHFFDVWKYEGELASCEGQDFDWFEPFEPAKVEFLPVNYEILTMLQDREKAQGRS